jgi:hypothetical protein
VTATALYGTTYDLDETLAAARGSSDWIGRYGGWLLAILLLATLLSAISLMTAWASIRGRERDDRRPPAGRHGRRRVLSP